MPISPDILIAEQVKGALNGQTFSEAFTAERVYSTEWSEKDELTDLMVGVWAGDPSAQLWEREQLLIGHQVGVTFAKKVSKASLADIDALADLVNEVALWLELRSVTAGGELYANTGWDYIVRVDASRLMRQLQAGGGVTYTGMFASAIQFNYEAQS